MSKKAVKPGVRRGRAFGTTTADRNSCAIRDKMESSTHAGIVVVPESNRDQRDVSPLLFRHVCIR
jgi:hypothetical protein